MFEEGRGKLLLEPWLLEVENPKYLRNVLWEGWQSREGTAAERGLSWLLSQLASPLLRAFARRLLRVEERVGVGFPAAGFQPGSCGSWPKIPVNLR